MNKQDVGASHLQGFFFFLNTWNESDTIWQKQTSLLHKNIDPHTVFKADSPPVGHPERWTRSLTHPLHHLTLIDWCCFLGRAGRAVLWGNPSVAWRETDSAIIAAQRTPVACFVDQHHHLSDKQCVSCSCCTRKSSCCSAVRSFGEAAKAGQEVFAKHNEEVQCEQHTAERHKTYWGHHSSFLLVELHHGRFKLHLYM